jgi:ATP-binding cassette, subfamily B, bacterial
VKPDQGWRTAWQIVKFLPRRYFGAGCGWAAAQFIPLLAGLALKATFDRIADGDASVANVWPLLAGFVAAESARSLVIWLANSAWPAWFLGVMALLRANGLRSVLCEPEPPAVRLPGSSGEAMARLRDDTEDIVWFVDNFVDIAGAIVFTIVAAGIMIAIDPLVTLVVVIPMAVVLLSTRALQNRLRRLHDTSRRSGAVVSSLVGGLMDGVLALKVAGAEGAAIRRMRAANAKRGDDAVRAALILQALETWAGAAVDVTVGLILLLVAPSMRRGEFTVGDLALFMTYVGWLTALPRMTGRTLARHRQSTVAIDRLTVLAPNHDPREVAAHHPVYLYGPPPPVPAPPRDAADRLERLDVEGLAVRVAGSSHGVHDVSFTVNRGEMTVITGAVGAGKTTLLRGLLGLLPADAGTIRWNGARIDDPAASIVPPRCAYVPQAPRLLSDTLEENVVLGWPVAGAALPDALRRAAMDRDVAEMDHGGATVVGPRGARLSGGQVLRTAAARALIRNPELLVLDDVSSGLDVEVERQLWERLLVDGATCLAVSHRRAVLGRAHHIVVLEEGRVVGVGPLAELLDSCAEMRRLWRDESLVEEEEALR